MRFLYILLLLGIFSACSKDIADVIPGIQGPDQAEPESPEPTIKNYKLRLGAKEKKSNIFHLPSFHLFNEENFQITIFELHEAYDSITWSISNQKGSFKILDTNSFTFEWSHSFYLPGHYDTYLHCYKNNRIIHGDTLSIDISNDKDFLMYNWDEVKEPDSYSTGYHNVLDDNYVLCSIRKIYEKTPAIEIRFWNTTEDMNEFAQKSNVQLYDYICSVYNQPSYDREAKDLKEKYNELFSYQAKDATPHAIWLTPKSKIVLLMRNNEDHKSSWIYAEPQ